MVDGGRSAGAPEPDERSSSPTSAARASSIGSTTSSRRRAPSWPGAPWSGSARTRPKVTTKSDRGDSSFVRPISRPRRRRPDLPGSALTDPATGVLRDASEVAAIGFKAVHAKDVSGVQIVDEKVLAAMEAFADVCPAHNPPYIKAMRMLGGRFPTIPLVAAFETGFHRTIPEANQRYAVPDEWATEARDPPLGVPRGEPPLHRRPDGRADGPRMTSRSSPATSAARPPSAPAGVGSRSPPAWG